MTSHGVIWGVTGGEPQLVGNKAIVMLYRIGGVLHIFIYMLLVFDEEKLS